MTCVRYSNHAGCRHATLKSFRHCLLRGQRPLASAAERTTEDTGVIQKIIRDSVNRKDGYADLRVLRRALSERGANRRISPFANTAVGRDIKHLPDLSLWDVYPLDPVGPGGVRRNARPICSGRARTWWYRRYVLLQSTQVFFKPRKVFVHKSLNKLCIGLAVPLQTVQLALQIVQVNLKGSDGRVIKRVK